MQQRLSRLLIATFILLALPLPCLAHGVAGKRFFPTTFQIDDPFVSDEFSFLVNHVRQPGDEPARATELNVDFAKRITPTVGLELHDAYLHRRLDGGGNSDGWENLEVGAKWQAITSDRHEAIVSLGTAVEIGGTGARRISENTSTVSPALFFGKGFGDLPDAASFLKPFALTGAVGPNFPTASGAPTTLTWGFSLQYSLQYLQSFVKDIGLPAPLNRITIVTEFPLESCLELECKGQTTGTVNPGIVWAGKGVEFGIAAQIPINSRSGNSVGVLALFHLFLDDIFPRSIGRPILQ